MADGHLANSSLRVFEHSTTCLLVTILWTFVEYIPNNRLAELWASLCSALVGMT